MLYDYSKAILSIGRFYAVPVADLYAESGLNRFDLKHFTFEELYPTNEGYRFIIGPLFEALSKL